VGGSGGERLEHPTRFRRRAQTWLSSLALVVLILGTVGGVVLARDRALDAVQDRAGRTAENGAALLEIDLREVAAGLSGAAAVLRDDGSLDVEVFRAFADDPLAGAEDRELALIDIVSEAERAAFEARAGAPITVVDERGRVAPAPSSPTYHAILSVEPDLPGRGFVGWDISSDPQRRAVLEAAERTGAASVGAVVDLAGDGSTLMLAVRPLVGASDEVQGFIATGIPMARVQETIETPAGSRAPVALVEGDTVISGDEIADADAAASAPVDLPQGDWRVLVGQADGPDLALAWLVAAGGGVAILAMGALVLVTERHQRRLARANALLTANEVRSLAVQVVAGRLARALGGGDVATALVDHLPAAVGARSAVVAMRHRSGRLEVIEGDAGADGRAEGTEPRMVPVPVVGSVVDGVLARREPAWLSSPLGWRGDEAAAALAGDGSALAVLPLLAEDVSGVLAVSYPQLHIFGDDERALLQTVGVLAAQALARGRRYDAEHQTAVAFQQAALPDELPEVDGAAIAARYRPATHGATVGGDWYDVLVLDEDRILLVVGDVVGHGMVAAAAMGRLRTAFQTIVPFGADPGFLLQTVSQQVATIPDAFCTTVVCAMLDLRTGDLTWSRAGHPPPLVVGAGGPTLLDARCQPPLGVTADAPARVHQHVLAPGDVLVLYTDGLVERRDESLDQGFRRLGAVAEQLVDLEPGELSDALVEALVPAEEQTDDLAVLVVRFDGRSPGG
jgi:serine phosphatase RsbU (regulator of sigma subunit)